MLAILVVGPDPETVAALRETIQPGKSLLVRERVIRDLRDCHKLTGMAFLAIVGLPTLDGVLASYLQGLVLRPLPC